ncbi:DEAD/DEAH box helicase [Domibacillus sp. A3M-37]|uniref:DEAD/DEAH box helicase n=1 Tax=Domibacillus sp. A3M-37 TaxID=2962037 RepID=UPI0020B8B01F|nr:DEAD/DEAH box helicase [Domibacillus sp. A3M-37]MCP3764575.1 DEAD/DEAH box helicase [Domibacillus sp. A3M-37]
MAYLACVCGEMMKGIQISRHVLESGEYRRVEYPIASGLTTYVWKKAEGWMKTKSDAVYCEKCHSEIDIAPQEEVVIADVRIPGVHSKEFKSVNITTKLKELSEKEEANIYVHRMEAKEPVYGQLDQELPDELEHVLSNMGIAQLYSHQAETYNEVRKGNHVVLVTQTASGKTLSYNLPVLQGLIENSQAHALYLFPTKALADDQLDQLFRWNRGENSQQGDEWYERSINIAGQDISYGRFDGDTPLGSRRRLMESGRILFSNPDILHFTLLKSPEMKTYFSKLKYVVIDEMHLYRGAFGTHVSMVLRRLRSICAELGNSHIQFILCSATINKPEQLAASLTGLSSFSVIDNDGSHRQERSLIFWNPGFTKDTGLRKAPLTDALAIAENVLVQNQRVVRSIIFQGSRLQGKVADRYMKDVLRKKLKLKKEKVQGLRLTAFYNGMMAPEERKQVIAAIKESEVHIVLSTNALEVGIDLGELSFALIVGYPGSKAAFSQQIGRVGRNGEGVSVMIFEDEPLQQYYMNNPTHFLEKAPEVVRIDPENRLLLSLHLAYLQEDLGREINEQDVALFTKEKIDLPEKQEEPLERCSLRSVGGPQYTVISNKRNEVIVESVDEWIAHRDFHEGAIFWNTNSKAFRMDSINKKTNEVIAIPLSGEAEYYTQSVHMDTIQINDENQVLSVDEAAELVDGNLKIKRSVVSFLKNYFHSRVSEPVSLLYPLVSSFETEGVWLLLKNKTIEKVREVLTEGTEKHLDGAIRAAEHAILSVIPDTVICDARDISAFSSFAMSGFDNQPVIGFYGGESGGMGITQAVKEHLERIIRSAHLLVSNCSCKGGCPSCIQYPGKDNTGLSKKGAEALLLSLEISFQSIDKAVLVCR